MRKTGDAERKPRQPVTALRAAVKLLSARPYSEKKLCEKLYGKFPADEVSAAIHRLRAERLLDDRKYAEDFVRVRVAARPRSGFMLLRELAQRGIPRAIAQEVVNQIAPKDDDEKLARELLARKRNLYQDLDEPTRRRRLAAYLARRGFSYSVIEKVLRIPPGADIGGEDL